jgi:hypothetical protein
MGEKLALPSTAVSRLASLVSQAVKLDAGIKARETHLEGLKQEIRDLVYKYRDKLPIVASSRVIPLSTIGKALRVTYTAGTPVMDYDALRDAVGGELFMQITQPTRWELDPEHVTQAINDELLTESALKDCIRDPAPRKASVYWDAIKGTEVADDE